MYQKAANYIKKRINSAPRIGIILGTGLGASVDTMKVEAEISYGKIPGFRASTAPGHAGRLLAGKLNGVDVLVMQGRMHYYEGYAMKDIALPVQTMAALGVETLVVTNASGGINESYAPGEIVLISDHIKFDLESPLRGENREELGNRFFDMTKAYSPELLELASDAGERIGISLKQGVYAYMGGPQFETPAEIRMLGILGADMVGMSTVPEVIAAVHCGMRVLGLSCVTNMAAGMENGGLNHAVIDQAEINGKERMRKLLREVVKAL